MSAGKDQEYFSDGLAEELTNALAKVPGLKVAGRSSAFQFKGKNEDVRTVGQKLNVANVLEGSVRRDGSRVRITAELTKAEDGFQLWSEEYNTEIKDIFAVQDEIARAVTGALQIKLLGANGTPPLRARRSPIPTPTRLICKLRISRIEDRKRPTTRRPWLMPTRRSSWTRISRAAWALRSSRICRHGHGRLH